MLSRSGETCSPSTSTSSPRCLRCVTLSGSPTAQHPAEEPRAADAAREHGHLHAAALARREASTLRVCGPRRGSSRSRSATVSTSSMRFGELDQARRRRARRTARRCPARRRGDEELGRRERERVRRPVGGRREREPVGREPRRRARAGRAASTHGRSALTTSTGDAPPAATTASRPASTAAPWPRARLGDDGRAGDGPRARGVTTNVGPTAAQAATTSASIARASSRARRPATAARAGSCPLPRGRGRRASASRGAYRGAAGSRSGRRRRAGRRARPTRAGRTSATRGAPRPRADRCAPR